MAQPKQKPSRTQRRKSKVALKEEAAKEIAALELRIRKETPPSGHNPLLLEDAKTREIEPHLYDDKPSKSSKHPQAQTHLTSALLANIAKFSSLPISQKTIQGLDSQKFTHLTKVQRATLPHALAGRDIIAEARTGSGKTLAFLIPLLEKLYRNEWNARDDGLGAIVLCPTRELAIQVFDVLRKIGSKHAFSAALIVGGKDFEEEQKILGSINILVSTPGRLMHHMETNYHLDTSNVRLVILDEADYILELGFDKQLQSILNYLPSYPQRQTLLFSATMSSAVKKLAKLNMHEPELLTVHLDDSTTPNLLDQRYLVTEASEKVDTIYTFIKTHLKSKTIIFFNTCNEVQFFYEMFSKLRPGIVLRRIHGKIPQLSRMDIYYDFCNREHAVLLATDIAARGLDFPNVDWVVQADCPANVDQYIHRAGRTARFQSKGKALLLLLPSEVAIIEKIEAAKISIKKIETKLKSKRDMVALMSSIIAEDHNMKYLGQKCFISYIRSIYLAEDKDVFDISRVDGIGYALSLGLPGVPVIKKLKESQSFLKAMSVEEKFEYLRRQEKAKLEKKRKKIAKQQGIDVKDVVLEEDIQEMKRKELARKKKLLAKKGTLDEVDMLLLKQNQDRLHVSRRKMAVSTKEDEDDDFLVLARENHDISDAEDKNGSGDDEDGSGSDGDDDDDNSSGDNFQSLIKELDGYVSDEEEGEENMIEVLKKKVKEGDLIDKANQQKRTREKHQRQKEARRKALMKLRGQMAEENVYSLGGGDDEDDEYANDDDDNEYGNSYADESSESESDLDQPQKKRVKHTQQQQPKQPIREINLNESSDDDE